MPTGPILRGVLRTGTAARSVQAAVGNSSGGRWDEATKQPAAAMRPNGRGRARFTVLGTTVEAEPIEPGLHVVATPIGNLRDITLRGLAILAAADAVLAEDTRVSRVLLAHYGISTPLVAYHEHNAAPVRPQILARLADGRRSRADLGCRHAARLRSRLQARGRSARCGSSGHDRARAPRRCWRAGAGRPAHRPLLLRRLPAREERRRGGPAWPNSPASRARSCSSNRRVAWPRCSPMSRRFWDPGRPPSRAN